jgi:hypothetical protein
VPAEALHGDELPALGRIHDLHLTAVQALEDDVVVEVPMEDGGRRQEGQPVQVDGDGAPAKPQLAARIEQDTGRDAVAAAACHLAHLVQGALPAVVTQHRGQACGAAVRGGQLAHLRHLPAPLLQPLQRREALQHPTQRLPVGLLVSRHQGRAP